MQQNSLEDLLLADCELNSEKIRLSGEGRQVKDVGGFLAMLYSGPLDITALSLYATVSYQHGLSIWPTCQK